MIKQISISFLFFCLCVGPSAFAACGGTVRTWDGGGGNNQWTTANNWTADNEPDTTGEDAVLISSDTGVNRINTSFSIGCLEVQSGVLRTTNNKDYTINGDYFRAVNQNTFEFRDTDTGTFIIMAGTADQTFEVADPINNLRINNNNTVTITKDVTIRNLLEWQAGATGTIVIDANVVLATGSSALTVPTGATLELAGGASLLVPAGITVNGTLKVKAGATLKIGNGATLTIASGAVVQLTGADGNPAALSSTGAGSTFTFSLSGSLDASYFRIDRLDSSGIDVASTGIIQGFDYGELHYLADSGYAITLAAGATIPATADSIGFFDDSDHGTILNVDATSYNGTDITFDDWVGGVGGETNDTDPNNKIDWGAQGGTALTLSDNTVAGNPSETLNSGDTNELFSTFAFALNQADTATSITEVTVTMDGTANSGDISAVRAYRDAGGGTSCVYDSGVDTQIGTDQTLSGTPLVTTFTITPGNIQTSSDTNVACLHIVADIAGTAQHGKTVRFTISSTGDVTNSQGYTFSGAAGPPVSGGTAAIDNGATFRIWQGDAADSKWSRNGNWSNGTSPDSTLDCIVGPGSSDALLNNATQACRNGDLDAGGTIDWGSAAQELGFYGSLQVDPGYTFSNTTGPAVLAMRGAVSQSLSLGTAFNGSFIVANTGTSPNDVVSAQSSGTINGTLAVSDGTLRVVDGVTLTVNGNITVASGGTLDIEPGGTLKIGDGFTLTVAVGGTLEMVGSVSKQAQITSATPQTDAYNVVINGTISARYYRFDSLGTGGVSIEAGATIDATNHLQNGSFTYPIDSAMTLLFLKRQVPTNSMDNMNFELNGSSAASVMNINTTGAGAGTLSINSYSGDLSGPSFDTDPTYGISWTGATNTISITQDNVGPATVAAGGTYKMGRFAFQQDQAGASFNDADITSLTLTLTGNGAGSDVDEVRLFYDDDCNSSAGSLLGSKTFSGNPAKATFAIGAGNATVEADVTTPPKRCIYVEYDVANAAQNGKTLGVKINASGDFVNDQSYAPSGATTFPVTLGTAATISGAAITIWTGTTSTNWTVGTNWSAGVPDSTKTCEISVQANQPTVPASTTATCNSVIIKSGATLSLAGATSNLDVYGAFGNSGTFTQSTGVLTFRGSGDHTITSSSTLGTVSFNKAAGTVQISGSVTINTLNLTGASVMDLIVGSGKTLILPNGVTISGASIALEVQGSGTLQFGSGQTLTVAGGTFETSGVADQYPQNTSNKALVTVQGGVGTWGFLATSGTVTLSGFLLDNLDTNGVRLNGTTTLSTLQGGQLRNLSETYGSVIGFQFNTTNVPATANDIGWNWSPDNTPPSVGDGYLLASSTGCGSNTITFDRWFGDFFVGFNEPDTNTKVSAVSCTISIAASASPVSLTNFFATGYDGVVSLDWITGLETSHRGFNVYRSDKPYAGYVQINSELIKNVFFSTSFHGAYRFMDTNVTNGKRYYYMIEDMAYNGAMNSHGPVTVIPTADNGPPPETDPEVSEGSSSADADNGNGPDTGEITNAALVDLGNGAHILAQTSGSFRIEIVPPAAVFSVSPWDGAYEKVEVPGYSTTLDVGFPELAERYLLVEVDPSYTTAAVLDVTVEEGGVTSHQMQPAPSYAPDGGGQLQPSYSPDAGGYGSTDYAPTTFFSVDPTLQQVAGRKFVKIRVNPLLYQASTQQVRTAARILIDVGLDGKTWTPSAPQADLATSPAAVEGVARIRYRRGGMHAVSFGDLEDLGIEGPFDGVAVDDLRLYFRGREMPIEIDSADGVFGPGDTVRFWATHVRHKDTDFGEVVLSTISLGDSTGPSLRVGSIDGSPVGLPASSLNSSRVRAEAEQDLVFISAFPIAEQEDHFYWGTIYTLGGAGTDGLSFFDLEIDLPQLDRFAGDVRVNLYVLGRNLTAANVTNHIGVWVNNVPYRVSDVRFGDGEPTRLSVLLPASYFVPGINSLRIEAMGDTVPNSTWEAIDVDRVQVEYYASHVATGGRVTVTSPNADEVVALHGFDPAENVVVYDTSDPEVLARVTDITSYSPDGGATQSYEFAPVRTDDYGYRFHALQENQFLRPSHMFLEPGFGDALRSSSREADLIVIGNGNLLDAVEALVDHRRSQGMRVVTAPLAQIYAEFSNGLPVTEGIRDFLTYTRTSWKAPAPRYVLFVGDGTSDPRNHLGGNASSDLMPIPIDHGYFIDFGSDTWYVREEGSVLPTMAVGRLPSQDPEVLRGYVKKLLAYEAGTLAPSGASALRLNFVSDSDGMNERFRAQSQSLVQSIQSARPQFQVAEVDRATAASDAQAKQAINTALNDGVLLMNYLGHGAEGMWASGAFYDKSDASALSNARLPIVVALNCLNTHFYRPDGSTTLGESFVLNPNGGSIAFYGSTAMTVPGAQTTLAQALYGRLAQETAATFHRVAMGDIILQAQTSVAGIASMSDTLKSYTLFGDPSMPLPKSVFAAAKKAAPIAAPAAPAEDGGGCGAARWPVAPSDAGFTFPLLMWLLWSVALRRRKARG